MKWVKASERLPEFKHDLIWRFSDKSAVDIGYTPNGFKFMGRHFLKDDNIKLIEWLDESDPNPQSKDGDVDEVYHCNQCGKDFLFQGLSKEERLAAITKATTEYLQSSQPKEGKEWIRVEEMLPNFNQQVLVFGVRRLSSPQMGGNPPIVTLGQRQDLTGSSIPKADRSRYVDKNHFRMMENVTHWMPLPTPPDTEKQK